MEHHRQQVKNLRHRRTPQGGYKKLTYCEQVCSEIATRSKPLPSSVETPNYALDNRIAEDLPQTRQSAAARHKMNYSAMLASF